MIRVEKTMFHAADGLLKKILIDLMKGIFFIQIIQNGGI